MAKQKPTEVVKLISKIEETICNGNHSNEMTMYYFAALSYYYYCGGKMNLENKLTRSGIFESSTTFHTEKSKLAYINIAKTYIFGGIVLIHINKILHKNNAYISGVDTLILDTLVNNLDKSILYKYNMRIIVSIGNVLQVNKDGNITNTVEFKEDMFRYAWQYSNWLCNILVKAYGGEYDTLEDKYYEIVRYITANNF